MGFRSGWLEQSTDGSKDALGSFVSLHSAILEVGFVFRGSSLITQLVFLKDN